MAPCLERNVTGIQVPITEDSRGGWRTAQAFTLCEKGPRHSRCRFVQENRINTEARRVTEISPWEAGRFGPILSLRKLAITMLSHDSNIIAIEVKILIIVIIITLCL